MKKETYICCKCKKKFTGFGNNPWGILDKNNTPIEWKETDRCCDLCNSRYVVPGRLYLMMQKKKEGK